jgi:nitrite reductase/ring-hydroxylating ferredoxin subunit
MAFPPDAYAEGARFQLEKRRLFAAAWLPVCAVAQIAAPGDFVSQSIGGWPVLVIRGADGRARGFRNVCRHQGMPVVEQPAGRCDVLRCRYHGWTYDLAGALIEAPQAVAPDDPGASTHRLEALALDEADGMIQLRAGGDDGAAPRFGLADARLAGATATDIDANWKCVVEALLADPAWRLVWPLAVVGPTGTGAMVRQVVPRGFLRTRLIDLAFGAPAAAPDIKRAAETAQAERAAGTPPEYTPAIADFHARLIDACGL